MNAATQWFKFDPLFIGTPMKGEWCLWSFVTKHGRECYSGRWIVHEGADLIVTDRGWSVPLVVGEAYFARVIPLDLSGLDSYVSREDVDRYLHLVKLERAVIEAAIIFNEFGETFAEYRTGAATLKLRASVDALIAAREETTSPQEGVDWRSLVSDSIPEIKYLGSTPNGEQVSYDQRHADASAYSAAGAKRVATTPPPINQKYAPGTRVRIADDLGSAMRHFPKGRMAIVRYTHAHAFGGDDVKSYCLDVDGIGETSWYNEDQLTAVYYRERMKISEPTQSVERFCVHCECKLRFANNAPSIAIHERSRKRECENGNTVASVDDDSFSVTLRGDE